MYYQLFNLMHLWMFESYTVMYGTDLFLYSIQLQVFKFFIHKILRSYFCRNSSRTRVLYMHIIHVCIHNCTIAQREKRRWKTVLCNTPFC